MDTWPVCLQDSKGRVVGEEVTASRRWRAIVGPLWATAKTGNRGMYGQATQDGCSLVFVHPLFD